MQFLSYTKSFKAETAFSNYFDVKQVLIRKKIDFFTIDLRETSCIIYSEKYNFRRNPVDRWIFCLVQTYFYIMIIRNGTLVYGAFDLG